MIKREFKIDGRTLAVNYDQMPHVDSILDDVIGRDSYGLVKLKASGYKIGLCVDIGAHMGFFAAMIHHLWPNARMICFEPDPRVHPALRLNTGGEVLDAVVRYDNCSEFYLSDCTGGSLVYEPTITFSEDIPQKYKKIKVKRVILEQVVNGPIDLLKLDCEGSEFDILCRMSLAMRQKVKRIVGEYHHISGYRYIEQIIKMRYPHLTPRFTGVNPLDTISLFEAA